jgi:hypothetical protein
MAGEDVVVHGTYDVTFMLAGMGHYGYGELVNLPSCGDIINLPEGKIPGKFKVISVGRCYRIDGECIVDKHEAEVILAAID